MQIESFFQHWGITENPFSAEEARDDPIFRRLLDHGTAHPDFDKVYGQPDQPRAAVVFGEKGSGKTAFRLIIERRIEKHNHHNPDRKAWIVRYDDLNPILDRFAHAQSRSVADTKLLERFRLADHQDAILSLATTKLIDQLLEGSLSTNGEPPVKVARHMSRQRRIDLLELAMLYDQPHTGHFVRRWARLRRMLRISLIPWASILGWGGAIATLLAVGAGLTLWMTGSRDWMYWSITGAVAAIGLTMLGARTWRAIRTWVLARKIRREIHVVERTRADLRSLLSRMPLRELNDQPIPVPGDQDSRYQLTGRLLDVLEHFDYASLVVMVDRVDEPSIISGDPARMKLLVWPIFNNKFLQQSRVGLKFLLPIELRHELYREDATFFQQARLDKQHLIDRLTWSGSLLYDLCTRRLQICQAPDSKSITLRELFESDVSQQELIDALDHMQQPRDAFKFLYNVVHEHCANVPEDQAVFKIPRLTLENVRKSQSRRVQELYRGFSPA